ncbi:Synaptopodin [Manis javanica]|nr:Synaptopodin [Manis javanica]
MRRQAGVLTSTTGTVNRSPTRKLEAPPPTPEVGGPGSQPDSRSPARTPEVGGLVPNTGTRRPRPTRKPAARRRPALRSSRCRLRACRLEPTSLR